MDQIEVALIIAHQAKKEHCNRIINNKETYNQYIIKFKEIRISLSKKIIQADKIVKNLIIFSTITTKIKGLQAKQNLGNSMWITKVQKVIRINYKEVDFKLQTTMIILELLILDLEQGLVT